MKRIATLSLCCATVALAVGCSSTQESRQGIVIRGSGPAVTAQATPRDTLTRQQQQLAKSIVALQAQIERNHADMERVDANLQAARKDLYDATLQIKPVKDRIDSLQNIQQTNAAAAAELERQLGAELLHLKALEGDIGELPRQIDTLRKDLDREKTLRKQETETSTRERSRADALEKRIADLQQQMAGANRDARETPVQVITLERQLSAIKDLRQADAARIKDLETELARQKAVAGASATPAAERAAAGGKVAQLQDRLAEQKDLNDENAKRIAALEKQLDAQKAKARDAEDRLNALPRDIASLQKQLDEEKARTQREQALASAKDREIEDLRKVLAEQKKLLRDVGGRPQAVAAAAATRAPATEPTVTGSHDDAARWVAEANNLLRDGKAVEAKKLYEDALRVRPAMITAMVGLAACQYTAGELSLAEATADGALKLDERNAQALGVKGIVNWRRESYRNASSYLERAIASDPNDPQLYNWYGVVLSSRGRTTEAIDAFRKVVAMNPRHAEATFNLAALLATATPPKLDEARGYYSKALSLGSEHDPDLDKLLGATGAGGSK